MQLFLLLISLILLVLYTGLLVYYYMAWQSIPGFNLSGIQYPASGIRHPVSISVIIPARNEAANLPALLGSLSEQSYPAHLFEVLIIDDHSTDNTSVIVRSSPNKNVRLISLQEHIGAVEINSYKKKAIEVGVNQSTGTLIVTTDADCYLPPNWLQTIAAFYEQYKPSFIAAPVAFLPSPKGEGLGVRFIEIFQALDFMTLQGITGAAVHKKILSMCNGANMAYGKKVFTEVGGFTGIDNIASGDDMLLMHKIAERYPEKVMFLKSAEAIVHTAPVKTIGEFFNQRIRWASKADKYDDKRILPVLLVVYLFNLLLLLIPIITFFYNPGFPFFAFHFSLFTSWLMLLLLKTTVELLFLLPVSQFFGKQKLLWFFPLMQPFHIIYTVVAGWLGKFGSYQWKERKVK